MTDFSQMHVFFFISSIATIVLGFLLAVIIVFFIKILNDIKYITGKARTEADLIADDLSNLRGKVRSGGLKLKYFLSFLGSLYKHHKK